MRRNIVQGILDHTKSAPQKPAIRSPGFELTFDQLSGIVLTYGLHLQRCGVSRRSTIAVHSGDPIVVIASALAAALVGCAWVFDGEAMARAQAVQVTHRFRTLDVAAPAPDGCTVIDTSWTRPPDGHSDTSRPRFPGFVRDDATWLIFPSSGTTGTPKFMALSHETTLDRIAANAVEFPTGNEACAFLFAVHSPPTLIRAICALTCGASLVLSTDTDFWTASGVTHVFGSPSQIKHVLPDQPLPTRIAKALIGGDFLPDELASRLLQSFDTVVNTYGSTETNLVVENAKSITDNGKISTHTVWHDTEIEIVDETDQPLAPGVEGIVRIRNEFLVQGYLNSPEAEAVAFRNGWFYPGDRGVVTQDRDFTVTGRTNDTFNLGGVKVNAALMDFVLQSVPGVDDAVCFMMPARDGLQELIALIRASAVAVTPDIVSEARIQIATTFSTEATPAKFIFSDVIPRTENGKPDRLACVAMAMSRRAASTR